MARKTKPYRAGLIGAGAIAHACHAPGYERSQGAQLVAAADPSPARHRELREAYPGVKLYWDYRTMLESEGLDVVSVCSPNCYHAKQAIAALEAKCHVLCEKPMAVTLGEAERMQAAARKARRKLMVGFTHRLYAGPQRCKQLLKERALGKPFMVRVRFAHEGPYPGWARDRWFYDPALAAGGALLDMGIHAIDLCRWLIGPIASVQARTATLAKKIAVDDNAVLLLEFTTGALGYIEVGWTSKPGFAGLEIYGSKGSLICDYFKGLQQVKGAMKASGGHAPEWETLEPEPTRGGWDIEIDHWIDVLQGRAKLEMDATAGREALAVALAAYESNKTGRRINLA
jgi:UDP-N-acetylglucosamine 3-dehydrogenase